MQDRLNNLRNMFTFISQFLVLALSLLIFTTVSSPSLAFMLTAGIVVVISIFPTVFFLCTIKEKRLCVDA